jgi:cell division protein FtsW
VNEVYVKPGHKVEGVFKRASVWVARVNNDSEEKKVTDPEFRITDENYQPSHAMIAVARGGKSPFGVLPGNSTERDVLPQAYSDYIFAIIVEEWGIIGSIFLILIYLAILFRACLKSSRYADYSAMMMVMGLALMITCQALISMMVSVGIGPVTGQPLPMISRGGTSVLITSIYFGIIMSVSREQTKLGMLQQETINHSREEAPIVHLD